MFKWTYDTFNRLYKGIRIKKDRFHFVLTRRLINTCESLIRTFRRSSRSDKRTVGVGPSYTLKKNF